MHPDKTSLMDAALLLCKEAVAELDFRVHRGTHPTLGVIDNICFSPISGESLEDTAELARNFGLKLNEMSNIPIYFYGAASTERITLKAIRKSLGYFNQIKEEELRPAIMPSVGVNSAASMETGISCVGAVPLIVNFNMRFRPEDKKNDVIQVTKAVRVPDVNTYI
jgi:glutamate formiminotransferase